MTEPGPPPEVERASPVLALDGIEVAFGGVSVLDGVQLGLRSGEVLSLLGPSGAGKSTLLRVLLGLTRPRRGTVTLRGRVVSRDRRLVVPPEERNLAVVFQDLALWPHLTVAGNLRFVLRSRGSRRAEEPARIAEALEQVGLAGRQDRYPSELSGGEQQRVAVARALVLEPLALLLDEPLTHLDVLTKRALLELFVVLFRSRGTSVVHVTHDPVEAAALSSRVALLEGGRITHHGSFDAIDERLSPFARAVKVAARAAGSTAL